MTCFLTFHPVQADEMTCFHLPVSLLGVFISCVCLFVSRTHGQISFDREPISYSEANPNDPVTKLQSQIDSGELKLVFDEDHGYLKSVLEALKISHETQTLVFSKTSFQLRRISSRTPRALYFNDDSYVGWVQNGDVIEVASIDPELGAVFYTLSQEKSNNPKFIRDKGNCLTCHASSRTQDVPGFLVRSVYPMSSGQPHFGAGTFTTDHTSPFEKRWGGWYVSGTHGDQRHMGNVYTNDRQSPEKLDVEKGANVTDLSELLQVDPYLTPHSDLIALMVLEHQGEMHNRITRANYETRQAMHSDSVMNRLLERPEEYLSETSERRIERVADNLVAYLFYSDEHPLTGRIAGTSKFQQHFEASGIKDQKGRSLKDFDLTRKMFKYPCSYLVYSEQFQNLPEAVSERVYRKMWEVLNSQEKSEAFGHLSASDRRAILEILRDTHPALPAYWKEKADEKSD